MTRRTMPAAKLSARPSATTAFGPAELAAAAVPAAALSSCARANAMACTPKKTCSAK